MSSIIIHLLLITSVFAAAIHKRESPSTIQVIINNLPSCSSECLNQAVLDIECSTWDSEWACFCHSFSVAVLTSATPCLKKDCTEAEREEVKEGADNICQIYNDDLEAKATKVTFGINSPTSPSDPSETPTDPAPTTTSSPDGDKKIMSLSIPGFIGTMSGVVVAVMAVLGFIMRWCRGRH